MLYHKHQCQVFNRFSDPRGLDGPICQYFELALLAEGEIGGFEEIDGKSWGEMDV